MQPPALQSAPRTAFWHREFTTGTSNHGERTLHSPQGVRLDQEELGVKGQPGVHLPCSFKDHQAPDTSPCLGQQWQLHSSTRPPGTGSSLEIFQSKILIKEQQGSEKACAQLLRAWLLAGGPEALSEAMTCRHSPAWELSD